MTSAGYVWIRSWRDQLFLDRDYYVRTDGNDANSGRINTAAGGWLTLQHAVDVVSLLDIRDRQVRINIADGTYTGAVNFNAGAKGAFCGRISFIGNAVTPANVIISVTGNDAFLFTNCPQADISLESMRIQTAANGIGLVCGEGALVKFSNLDFGVCATGHMYANRGAVVYAIGNYAVSGNAPYHAFADGNANIFLANRTITYSNNPVFGNANIISFVGAVVRAFNMVFVNGGTVVGQRFSAFANAVIDTGGGGAAYIPGTIAGATGTGGQYI